VEKVVEIVTFSQRFKSVKSHFGASNLKTPYLIAPTLSQNSWLIDTPETKGCLKMKVFFQGKSKIG